MPSYLATLPREMAVSYKQQLKKSTSVTTYFKTLTTENNVFIVSVMVDALKPATPAVRSMKRSDTLAV